MTTMIDGTSQGQNEIRKQLTLFIRDKSEIIEKIRKQFNPIQHKIISAHVTLCREDEISSLDRVLKNLKTLKEASPLKINFDQIERFEDGKGVWLPASIEDNKFYRLRTKILKGVIDDPRQLRPHVTLMHPRNSVCTDKIFEQLKMYELPSELIFDEISLIEQKSGGQWVTIEKFKIQDVDLGSNNLSYKRSR